MRTFQSLTQALIAMLPNQTTMNKIGERLKVNFQQRIKDNKTTGLPVTNKTYHSKQARGARYPATKLREGDGLIDQMKSMPITPGGVKVGYTNEQHRKFQPGDKSISVAELVNIHHNNKEKPRQVVFIGKDEIEIIKDELRKRLRG